MTVRIIANISSMFRDNMCFTHCDDNVTESQEHLETHIERRRPLKMDTFEGKIIFWRQMAFKLKKLEDSDNLITYKANTKNTKTPSKKKALA